MIGCPVPGAEKETPWHQDQPYYPVDGHNLVGSRDKPDSVTQLKQNKLCELHSPG